MDSFYGGWLSILPPIIAIALALLTKEVLISLFIGILSGTVIYSLGMGLNPIVGSLEATLSVAKGRIDISILFFCFLLGGLVHVVTRAGGAAAYGRWACTRIKGKRSALLSTSILGVLIFVDDYFNCLTVGTVMRPVTDKYKVSRSKLAYIIDSTAAPVCIIAPVSSWAAAVGSNLRQTGAFESDISAFIATIPYNFYALLALLMVFWVIFRNTNLGKMAQMERLAEQNAPTDVSDDTTHLEVSPKGRVWDMVLPIGALILVTILGMLHIGGYWGPDPAYHNLIAAFGNSVAADALVWGGLCAVILAGFLYISRNIMSLKEFMATFTDGMKAMVPSAGILVLAWTISGVCNDLLMTSEFVSNTLAGSNIPAGILPATVFVIAAGLSFSTGTSWGTFGILIPIVVPAAMALNPDLLIVSLSATLGGSVFGDHCSPISDTTILSSTGAGCHHIDHVSTQLPYTLLVAGCCLVGYLVAGFTGGNLPASLGSSAILLLVSVTFFSRIAEKKQAALPLAKSKQEHSRN